jgi:2-C-methyl-D-erythritol 4-phosphate cytidylyltransferase
MLTAIIVAAGSSSRVGFDKLFAQIAGRPVIRHSLEAFERAECVDEIVVVCREATIDAIRDLAGGIKKLNVILPGGERRQDSVDAGLHAISKETDFVAVHDAARPLITPREIKRVFAIAREHGGAALAAPVTDTLKIIDESSVVVGSIERENVFAMQTPQIFARQLLVDAYDRIAKESITITDEVSVVQGAGGKVMIVPAEDQNMKITFAGDLALAEFILSQRAR